jgi:hypothetical protein
VKRPIYIGDKVLNNRLGPPAVGTVEALFSARYYVSQHSNAIFPIWNREYPAWSSGAVARILVDKAQRVWTFEEFQTMRPGGSAEEYNMVVQPVGIIDYPEMDLTLLDETVEYFHEEGRNQHPKKE